jgi:LacI family transcriptional regulator
MKLKSMAQKKRITISEVAKAANVSPATVSRILNHGEGSIKISQETQDRVLEVIRKMGYRRNPFAFALRAERTGVIGAIVRNLRGNHTSLIAHQLQVTAQQHGIEIMVSSAPIQPENIGIQLDLFQSQLFDGLLLLGDSANLQTIFTSLQQYTKPFVSISNNVSTPLVNVDDMEGVRLALEHLMSLGHTRIAFVGQPSQQGSTNRLRVFETYLKTMHLDLYRSEYIFTPPGAMYQPEDNENAIQTHIAARQTAYQLTALSKPPTAIFCSTDWLALGVIRGLQQQGVQVPEDISVIGFDDIIDAACSYPALTTIRQPREAMAEEAINLLMQLIEHPEDALLLQKAILIPPTLVMRESTGPVQP